MIKKSRVQEQVDKTFADKFSNPGMGRLLLEAQGLDPKRLQDVSAIDDGQPPIAPTGLKVTPFLGALSVEWDAAPLLDRVVKTVIEIKPPTGVARIVEELEAHNITVVDLDYVDYTIRIKHVDVWNKESVWSNPIVGKPLETAQYKIDLAKAEQLNKLSGLLPAINTKLAQGEEFGANVIKQVNLAQPDASNMLPLIEVDFEQWNVGQTWPPADTNKNGVQYITGSAAVGVTGAIVDRNGSSWLNIARGAGAGVFFQPFQYRAHGTNGSAEYIYSVYVQGVAGTKVALTILGATDSVGTGSTVLGGTGYQTLSGGASGERLYVKFTNDATKPFTAYRIQLENPNTNVNITKVQLEPALGKTQPSGWTPGVISTGVISARMLMAADANLLNAIIKDGSIQNALIGTAAIDTANIMNLAVVDAKVLNMKAGKLITDTLSATTITLAANGILRSAGNRVSFSGGGISMAAASNYSSNADAEYKVSSGSWGAFFYYDEAVNMGTRGYGLVATTPGSRIVENILEAKNTATGVRSLIALRVWPGERADILISGPDGVTIGGQGLYVNNDLECLDFSARRDLYVARDARIEQELWVDGVLTAENNIICTENLYMKSPNGVWWSIDVGNGGNIFATQVQNLPGRTGAVGPQTSDAGQRYTSSLTY